MRSAALLYLSLFAAGCAARVQQSPTPSPIVWTARDRAIARNVLELEGSNIPLMIPMLQLDSLATALVRLRSVDSVVAAELASAWSEDEIIIRPSSPSPDSLVRCAQRAAGISVSASKHVGEYTPFPLRCWSSLEQALTPVGPTHARIWGDYSFVLIMIATAPPVSRFALVARLDSVLGKQELIIVNFSLPSGVPQMVQEGPIWRLGFTRSWGDCNEACHFHHSYEYRYDTRTGRAWKYSDSGDRPPH